MGCATSSEMIWVKSGADENAFSRDRSACVHQSQSGDASRVDADSFAACMNQAGWQVQEKSNAQKEEIASQPNLPMQQSFEELKRDKDARCANVSYELFFRKTACDPENVTPVQMSDKSKVTVYEKTVLLKLQTEMQNSQVRAIQTYREYGGEAGERSAQILESWLIFNQKNMIDLYEGKQTWGDYNRARKNLHMQLSEALKSNR